ncbi:MAG: hypothetical protein A2Y10_14605 [Planctomycetes bacterium GWF2_41_51]|nr:MAG: hypothetical protein A2Y10_14605 [Planctomycetes bacterium GWF2_41_51]
MLASFSNCFAGDHLNLEEGLPVQVEDAYPTAYRNREVQLITGWQHNDDNTDEFHLTPVLEFGVWPNTELEISSDFLFGNADRTGSGNLSINGLYNFNQESLFWPAFAISGGLTPPTGEDNEGVDTNIKFIATKTVTGLHRIHFNLNLKNNDEPKDEERRNRYLAILGYSLPLNADTLLVMDYVREQQREKEMESNIFEIGARYKLTPRTVLAFGIGFGFGEESPGFLTNFGFQYSF